MNNKYKIVISNRNLYHEVELPVDAKTFKIGTSIDCDFRLHKEYFFEDIRFDFTNENGNWYVMCSDNTYVTTGDTRRLLTMELEHGDIITAKYQESNNDVFDMEFMIDFDSKNVKFERKIYLENTPKVSIGAMTENDIVLSSNYIINDKMELSKKGTDTVLNIIDSSYGVYHNGNKVKDKQTIKNGDFISISDYVFYYKDNALWTEIADNYSIKNLPFMDYPIKNNYPMFVRNTRLKIAWEEEDIEILDSPEKPQEPKNNLLMSLMPAMGMLIISGIMSFMGGIMVVFGIFSAIMAIITSSTSIIQGKKDYKKRISERIEKYNIYIKNKREEVEKKQEEERELLNQIYISKDEKLNRFNEFSSDLFDRNKEDGDFIDVRLGIGSIKSTRKIKYKKQERLEIEDDLQRMPGELCAEYERLDNAPIVCEFKNMNALGITGHKKIVMNC